MACPTLTSDHERNTSNTMSERHAQHSHLTMGGAHPRTMSKRPNTYIHQHDRTHLLSFVKMLCTHIWSCGNQSHSHIRMALNPRLSIPGNWPGDSILLENGLLALSWVFLVTDQVPPFREWPSALISDHVGTHPSITSKWPSTLGWVFLVTN